MPTKMSPKCVTFWMSPKCDFLVSTILLNFVDLVGISKNSRFSFDTKRFQTLRTDEHRQRSSLDRASRSLAKTGWELHQAGGFCMIIFSIKKRSQKNIEKNLQLVTKRSPKRSQKPHLLVLKISLNIDVVF